MISPASGHGPSCGLGIAHMPPCAMIEFACASARTRVGRSPTSRGRLARSGDRRWWMTQSCQWQGRDGSKNEPGASRIGEAPGSAHPCPCCERAFGGCPAEGTAPFAIAAPRGSRPLRPGFLRCRSGPRGQLSLGEQANHLTFRRCDGEVGCLPWFLSWLGFSTIVTRKL